MLQSPLFDHLSYKFHYVITYWAHGTIQGTGPIFTSEFLIESRIMLRNHELINS